MKTYYDIFKLKPEIVDSIVKAQVRAIEYEQKLEDLEFKRKLDSKYWFLNWLRR